MAADAAITQEQQDPKTGLKNGRNTNVGTSFLTHCSQMKEPPSAQAVRRLFYVSRVKTVKAGRLAHKGLKQRVWGRPEVGQELLPGMSRSASWSPSRRKNVSLHLRLPGERKSYQRSYVQVLALPLLEKPSLENPTTVNPMTEKPMSENPREINTNILNTNKINTYLLSTDLSIHLSVILYKVPLKHRKQEIEAI